MVMWNAKHVFFWTKVVKEWAGMFKQAIFVCIVFMTSYVKLLIVRKSMCPNEGATAVGHG